MAGLGKGRSRAGLVHGDLSPIPAVRVPGQPTAGADPTHDGEDQDAGRDERHRAGHRAGGHHLADDQVCRAHHGTDQHHARGQVADAEPVHDRRR